MRYFSIRFAKATSWEADFVRVWRPIGKRLHDGARLYLDGTGDNKPPLFELLNFALAGTPFHGLFFILLIGVANGLVAVLLWLFISNNYNGWYGLTAAGLWLLTLTHVSGLHINARSFGLAWALTALYINDHFKRGAIVGVAGLFYQYFIFLIPVLLWDSLREESLMRQVKSTFIFGSGGLVVLTMVFGIIGVVWGSQASLAGLYWSYGIPLNITPEGYATSPGGYVSRPWILTNTVLWGGYLLDYGSLLLPVLAVAALRIFRLSKQRQWSILMWSCLVLLIPLLIRSREGYWLLPLPFIIILAIEELATRISGFDPQETSTF
jgi:hypothetical protein